MAHILENIFNKNSGRKRAIAPPSTAEPSTKRPSLLPLPLLKKEETPDSQIADVIRALFDEGTDPPTADDWREECLEGGPLSEASFRCFLFLLAESLLAFVCMFEEELQDHIPEHFSSSVEEWALDTLRSALTNGGVGVGVPPELIGAVLDADGDTRLEALGGLDQGDLGSGDGVFDGGLVVACVEAMFTAIQNEWMRVVCEGDCDPEVEQAAEETFSWLFHGWGIVWFARGVRPLLASPDFHPHGGTLALFNDRLCDKSM